MAKVVTFPSKPSATTAENLRELADRIESGEFGMVHGVAWVADCGDGKVEVGLTGNSPLPGPTTHLILHMGMLHLSKL